jgi:hypothetical protein
MKKRDEQTKSRIYALKTGDFRNPDFYIDAIPCPEGFSFEGVNPYLTDEMRMDGIGLFLRWLHDTNKFKPVTNSNDIEGLNRTLARYIGHGMDLWQGLSYLVAKNRAPPSREQGSTQLEWSLWVSSDTVNELNSVSCYTGRILNRIRAIRGERNTYGDSFLERAKEIYESRQLEPYLKITSDTFGRVLDHREIVKNFGVDLIQRLLNDSTFDISDNSMLIPEEKIEYDKIIDRAYGYRKGLVETRSKSDFPVKEVFLDEQRRIDESLSGLEVVIKRFHNHVLDYSGVGEQK